ncbi:MAG: hypothetical protein AAGC80_23565 [Rhodococcus sp. (in: high G+C Gram-positive bacteria)]
MAAVAVSAVLLVSGCAPAAEEASPPGTTSTTTSEPPTLPDFTPTTTTPNATEQDADYSRYLLTADDLSDHEDTFTQRSSTPDADGRPGASAFFVNAEDNRAITDTIVVYPSAEEATAALRAVVADPPRLAGAGEPRPLAVGTNGTVVTGTSLEGDKAVTILAFTEGRTLVRLRFESAIGDTTSDSWVTSVGKMQEIALRTGLADPE